MAIDELPPFDVVSFDPDEVLADLGGGEAAENIIDHLVTLGAESVAVETQYVDRHFLDDYVHFYAYSFGARAPSCTRLHFFRASISDVKNRVWTAHDSEESLEEAERWFNADRDPARDRTSASHSTEVPEDVRYLGFVVLRPLETGRIGRTVLAPVQPAGQSQTFPVCRPYRVHLLGMRLDVVGLAFQQQDGGAAVCASTALWCALQRVARLDGQRTPTPAAITKAASSAFSAAHGLGESEMANAIAGLGYSVDAFMPAENRAMFRAKLVACLRSGLPVVLAIRRYKKTHSGPQYSGHAVTVTGLKGDAPGTVSLRKRSRNGEGEVHVDVAGASTNTLLVHDDNLGPYRTNWLVDSDARTLEGYIALELLRRAKDHDAQADGDSTQDASARWNVGAALVPKPRKLRMEIGGLFRLVLQWKHNLAEVFPDLPLVAEPRFDSGVAVRRSLLGSTFHSAAVPSMQRRLRLPRHVARIRFEVDGRTMVEAIHDATSLDHHRPAALVLLAPGVPFKSWAAPGLTDCARALGVPVLLGAQPGATP